MNLRIKIGDRSFALKLPDSGDVEIDLSEAVPRVVASPIELSAAGPNIRRLYRRIVGDRDSDGVVKIDVATYCGELNTVPVTLGKRLGALERMGLISREKRQRVHRSGKVLSHEVRVTRVVDDVIEDFVDGAKNTWAATLEDIQAQTQDAEAVRLFEAICRLCDVDGNAVATTVDILRAMDRQGETFPSVNLSALEDGGWIGVDDDSDGVLTLSVMEFENLGKGGMPWRDIPKP